MTKSSLILPLLIACSAHEAAVPTAPTASTAPPRAAAPPVAEPVDPALAAEIRRAAAPYRTWTRVDELPNIAPTLCRPPMGDDYGKASRIQLSGAVESPHGKKLYFLWASAKEQYRALAILPRPLATGFTIVKESFHAVPARTPPPIAAPTRLDYQAIPAPVTSVEIDGRRFEAGTAAGLYVMTKLGPADMQGTDAGWIYGTIAPNGTVTSAGRVATCMGCHEDAGEERLFGLPREK